MDFFKNIWDFIVNNAKSLWAGIVAGVVALLAFFGITFGGGDKPEVTTVPSSAVTTTAPTTTTTTAPGTTTTTPETTTEPEAVVDTFEFSLADIEALGLDEVAMTAHTINSVNSKSDYTIAGPKLKDVLEALGADMAAIGSGSSLGVVASDNLTKVYTFDSDWFMNDETVLALGRSDSPRLFPAPSVEFEDEMYVDNGLCVKYVCSLILTY